MKKKLFAIGSVLFLSFGLVSCGQGAEDEVSLKLWVDPGSSEFYESVVAEYRETYNIDYPIEIIESDTGKAQEYVKKDPEAAADVFSMPHDQLGQLVEAGVIYENTKYRDDVTELNTEQAVEAATYEGKMYGYPYGVESMMLYYDKSVLSEEDVQSFEGIVAKAKIGLNLEENGADYFAVPFFVSNGSKLYGDNGEDPNGTTFNDQYGVNVLKWIAAQKANPNVVQANADLMSQLENGSISALVSGPWGKDSVEEILGDNMGIATYPMNDFGNGSVQMKAFLGVKLYSVNAFTEYPLEAMALANYLAGEEAQSRAFDELGMTPSNLVLQETAKVLENPLASTVVEMATPEHTLLMPKIPEMVGFWPSALSVISDAYKGKIPENQMENKLTQLIEDTSTVAEE
ncbi:extracellular solute-binding protein [Enterococcus sp. LJL90]